MAEKKIRSEASSSRTDSGGNSRGESVVVDVGRRRSSCGYCKSSGHTSVSHGICAHSLTVDDYQDLLDRGWRRSGSFLYKPEMEKTCCPPYTIRLKASDFVPSKEQLRVSKRMQRFLDGTLDVKKKDNCMDDLDHSKGSCSRVENDITSSTMKRPLAGNNEEKNKDEQCMRYLSDQIDSAVRVCFGNGEFPSCIELPKASVKRVIQTKRKKLQIEGSEDLMYSSSIGFLIAAALRRADKDDPSFELTPNTIAEKLVNSLNCPAETSGFLVRACNGHINFYSSTKQACFEDVIDKITVIKEPTTGTGGKGSNSNESSKRPCIKRQKLEIHLKRSSFDPEEYSLYRRYQMKVHNETPDRVTESSYRRFLVDTPLVFVPPTGDVTVPPCGFGSFHQQYVVNGRVVAVGVIDILPKCLSSKYLFWDPDLDFLSLGKYSALQEISWVRENQAHCPALQYYYLGYYIHSCSKMTYKAAYRPSELLCPLRFQWVPFDIARPLLDRKAYVVLSDFRTLQDAHASASSLLENHMQEQHDVYGQEDSNDVCIEEDEQMADLDSEDSDDESDLETSGLTSVEVDDGAVGNILIGLKGARLRYKDLRGGIGPNERSYLETQMHRYVRAVGNELAERMVYSLR